MALLHELLLRAADRAPENVSLRFEGETLDYARLAGGVQKFASGAMSLGLKKRERIAIYLPKRPENVIAMFGAASAGCVFVPVNPLLKSAQVAYILRDCGVRLLVTSGDRLEQLQDALQECADLHTVVLVDENTKARARTIVWPDFMSGVSGDGHRVIESDVTSIFYTSGSTGKPKGVVLTHRNMSVGAESVATYLHNVAEDRILAVLPFSFDYGFSQLSTAFTVGASVTLLDYLLPRDIPRALVRDRITGLAGVPPLWIQLANLEWFAGEATANLRYITNSGGAMPLATLRKLQTKLRKTDVYLMYGLTEAFRSTYLPPSEVDRRPDSIGKAIPNAEVLVLAKDGSRCKAGEPGELVHRGPLVSLGYWNDEARTAARFKPLPPAEGVTLPEIAVWSGDRVRTDEEGYLYFMGREDDMIKTSGYRVSPMEVEEIVYETGLVGEVAAVGVPHPVLGQAIVLAVAQPLAESDPRDEALLLRCREQLPNYMVPHAIRWYRSLPRNPNGKIDRKGLATELDELQLFRQP